MILYKIVEKMPFILNFGGNKLDKIHIETAKRTDAGVILALIRELAVYENMSHFVEAKPWK